MVNHRPRPTRLMGILILGFCLCLAWSIPSLAKDEMHELNVIDKSSPRTLLEGFIATMDERYDNVLGENGAATTYLKSSRLYFTDEEEAKITVGRQQSRMEEDKNILDTSELPPAMGNYQIWRLTIQLMEILNRIELPPPESIPNAAEVAASNLKHWDLPGTYIRISRIENGPRTGDFVFNSDTVRRLPELYEMARQLPFRSENRKYDWYNFHFHTPAGVAFWLRHIIPPRWIYPAPAWANVVILDQPVWRWFGVMVVLGGVVGVFVLSHRLKQKNSKSRWFAVMPPLSLVITSPAALWITTELFRASNYLYMILLLSLWGLFFLSLTWATWLTGTLLAEQIINSERLNSSSIDSQLIRLVTRLISTIICIAILIEGTNRVGLPSYSVVAGLGISGIAVALAGQHTLANLLGSLIIMFEKPFRVGHSIRLGRLEGEVEDVGFRSARLRTPENTLVNVPCSTLVNNNIENLSLREYWRIRSPLLLQLETPTHKVDAFVSKIHEILAARPDVRHQKTQIALSDINTNGLMLSLDYTIKAFDSQDELNKRNQILMQILKLAESLQIHFERNSNPSAQSLDTTARQFDISGKLHV